MSREELRELVHAFRESLEALAAANTYGVPGLASESGPVAEEAAVLASEPEPQAEIAPQEPLTSNSDPGARHSLRTIREELGDCQRCPLSQERKTIVFGTGSENAQIMFIGEAPGAEEDKAGEPFVGESGRLLDKMIVAMGWTRESVYIANVLKCRPPNNRDPRASEVEACENFLAQQIQAVNPAVIVTLGKPAAHLLLKTKASMGSIRGQWQSYSGIPVMPTYHPAYLLREPAKKREVWADLQLVMQQFA